MNMTDKKSYYEYKPGSGSWWKKDVPYQDPTFQQGLNDVAGLNPFGEPILRVSWAGTLLHDYTEEPQLKYKLTYRKIVGYYYLKNDGEIGYTKSMNTAPDAAKPWKFQPKIEEIPLGRLRWVIEQWESAESLREKGRFQKLHDADGKKILRDLPPRGVYNHYFWVQSYERKFRDLDNGVLIGVTSMWLHGINAMQTQSTLDAIEQYNNRTLIGASAASAIWAGMGNN